SPIHRLLAKAYSASQRSCTEEHMARLIVSISSGEEVGVDSLSELELFVSVSRSTNGKPVTGLTKDNFRVVCGEDVAFGCTERMWQPGKTEPSGCYSFSLSHTPSSPFLKGEYYSIGIEARTFKGKKAVDFGQAVITVQSLGT